MVLVLFEIGCATKHVASTAPSQSTAEQMKTLRARSEGKVGPGDIYPDLTLTPGATNLDITQSGINSTICNTRWSTKSIRPPSSYTTALKIKQFDEYGDTDRNPKDYEEDHLISLELGGAPKDEKNLWPEPYTTSITDGGARTKDKVENFLNAQVCSGKMTLREAQQQIVTDWYKVYLDNHLSHTPSVKRGVD
jgi:hypothetical protein